ncbi:MAG: SxtJ family membrane protein [Planctomycetota bacterium]|nr:SxtJ family membrane protein [Planctomycetota bacterium]
MGLIEVKKDFSRRELLWFGPLFALFVGIVGAILIYRFHVNIAAFVLWAISAVLIVIYYVIPAVRRPVYLGWMYAVMPIGWVISHVLLTGIYLLLITPIGLLMRLVGYDPMKRRFDRSAETYWVTREPTPDMNRYFKQY